MLWVEKMIVLPSSAQLQYLLFEQIGVDGIESGERFVEYEQFRTVEHRDYELHFLRHAF